MSRSHPRRKLISALGVAVLFANLVNAAPAGAEPADPVRLTSQVDKLDKDGREVRGAATKLSTPAAAGLPVPVWPKAGDPVQVGAPVAGKTGARAAATTLTKAPGGVTAAVIDRATVPQRWRAGVVAKVAAPAGTTASVTIDYDAFKGAYGANWSSRLRMWRLPACALSTPEAAQCVAEPLPSSNDTASAAVTADVTGPGLVALSADADGDSGDFSASPLAPSSTWSVGGAAGGFSWAYPMRTPPGPGSLVPDLQVQYSSASVDGRSSATNNQPSWLGEGFELSPGFIERRYVNCDDDRSGTHNTPADTADLCWRSDNATISMGGGSTELIFEEGKGWHSRSEDGSKIEKQTGAPNGDDNGEYWKLTTTTGIQYFFGRHSIPGHAAATNSTWTVPVYSNHATDPKHATTFTASQVKQAWRWNLDYAIDTRGNTVSFWYGKETNKYAAEATESKDTAYDRGGALERIDYGTWDRLRPDGTVDRSVTPLAQVEFADAPRCKSDCQIHDGSHWPDTPWDQECTSDSCNDFAPTFWSTKRLSKITTRVWDTTKATPGWQDVDSYTFEHSFPSPGDGQRGGLWLDSIVHRGLVGTAVTMPPVTFHPVALQNRVLTKFNTTNNWQRLSSIKTESGEQIQITYWDKECSSTNLPASPQTNTKRCYPVIGPDPLSTSDADLTEYWHKYVVKQVSRTDVSMEGHQAPTVNTYYEYGGTPAWHYADDDGLSKAKYKTWDQFRGYGTVSVQVGDTNKTLTKTTYLRGMHGDRAAPSGGTRTVTVGASVGGETVYDEDEFAGMMREQVVYNGTEDKPVSKTVNVPWRSGPTASRQINGDTVTARFTGTAKTYQSTALGTNGSRGWRTTSTQTTFDPTYGTVTAVQDNGDIAKTGDEGCVTTTYNRNIGRHILDAVKQITETALPCGTAPTSPDHFVSDTLQFYDKAPSATTAPTKGDVTRIDMSKDWTAAAGTVWRTTSTTAYDNFGRPASTTDSIRANTTTVTYTPAQGLPTKRVDTNQQGWTTTTELNPAWQSPTKITDPNGRITETTYDGLGRTEKAWDQGWTRAAHPNQPSTKFTYVFAPGRDNYPHVKTEKINAAGGVNVSYQVYDALLRPRQTQTEAVGGGRVVTDTLYDEYGRAYLSYGAHTEPSAPSGTLWWEPEWSVPTQNLTLFDRAGRATASVFRAGLGVTNLVDRWRTTTTYEGDRTTVVPPDGQIAATTIVDAQGRKTELREYTTAAGPAGAYTATKYTYNAKDQLSLVVDAGKNEWTYKYDILGRQIESVDPDKGRTTSSYTDAGDLEKTVDARNKVLVHTYDAIGRKTATYNDAVADANKQAEWKYDKLYTGSTIKGRLTEHIRYDNGNAYKWQVRGFDQRYNITGEQYVIPPAETGLAGTYIYGHGFAAATGAPTTLTYPAAGDLPTETVTTKYNAVTGLPTGLDTNLAGVSTYVTGQQYTGYGEPTVTTLKINGGVYTEQSLFYELDTRRVRQTQVKPETAAGTVVDRNYKYLDGGTLGSVADTPQVGTADSQCFTYDPLQRLTSAWTPKSGVDCTAAPTLANLGGPAPYWQDWAVDQLGNRTSEITHGTSGDTERTFSVPSPGAGVVRPHAVTSVTTATAGQTATTAAYGYDAAGNMTSRPGATGTQTLAWNSEGKLAAVTEGSQNSSNLYDANGSRMIRRDAGGKTLYLPGQEIRATGSTATGTRQYSFNGAVVASRSAAQQSLTWLFGDHQGTQQTAVNAYTQAVTIRRQLPYGAPRGTSPIWPTTAGFVGGTPDPTGLVHIGAREYDPGLGRFISVDPIQDLGDPQQWNPYAYAGNDPISHSDPTGLRDDTSFYGPVGAQIREGNSNPVAAGKADQKRSNAKKGGGGKGNNGADEWTVRHNASQRQAADYLAYAHPTWEIWTEYVVPGANKEGKPGSSYGKIDILAYAPEMDMYFIWEVKARRGRDDVAAGAEAQGPKDLDHYIAWFNKDPRHKGDLIVKGEAITQEITQPDPLDKRQTLVTVSATHNHSGAGGKFIPGRESPEYDGVIVYWTRGKRNEDERSRLPYRLQEEAGVAKAESPPAPAPSRETSWWQEWKDNQFSTPPFGLPIPGLRPIAPIGPRIPIVVP